MSVGLLDRLKVAFQKPNPIWVRELRQDVRHQRSSLVGMGAVMVSALIVASVAASGSSNDPMDEIGSRVFQAFFTLAFVAVAMLAPTLASSSIASEREGRTWEALLMTGMRPKEIARGKFLAAYSQTAMFLIAIAPVGAMTFLFGGVHYLEVVIAFIALFVFAALWVAFGLDLSSRMVTPRSATLVTLATSTVAALFMVGVGGSALATLASQLWPRVPPNVPVWLPLAYVRGEFGAEYFLLLIALPTLAVALPAWAFYESTIANMSEPNDDRSTGLKRWFVVSSVILLGSFAVALVALRDTVPPVVQAIGYCSFFGLYLLVTLFMLLGDPLGASPRVVAKRGRLTFVKLWLGPGAVRTHVIWLVAGGLACLVLAFLSIVVPGLPFGTRGPAVTLAPFLAYFLGFMMFMAGLSIFVRSKTNKIALARAAVLGGVMAASLLPLFVAAFFSIAWGRTAGMLATSPSPFFAYALIDGTAEASAYWAGGLASTLWAVLGVGLFAVGSRKTGLIIHQYEAQMAATDAQMRREDEAFEAQSAEGTRAASADGGAEHLSKAGAV